MKIVLFTHYVLSKTASMPRFAGMIRDGMQARGHEVEEWCVPIVLGDKISGAAAKWLGYVDQFILFPQEVRRRLRKELKDTLFVVTDQALGMWVPLVCDRPHVIHCHDFLAQRSALGEIPQNPTGWSGRIYQRLIRRGFRQGRNFISVSHATQRDLHRFLIEPPMRSEVVWNGLNFQYAPLPAGEVRTRLGKHADEAAEGVILHVGGNQWYKNRAGVLKIYAAYVARVPKPLPLWMVGAAVPNSLRQQGEAIPKPGLVRFLEGFTNEQLQAAYCAARALLFPSLAEGFGWPIIEAMACGTSVLTTNQAPMNEIGGHDVTYIPLMPHAAEEEVTEWARHGAELLEHTILAGPKKRGALLAHAARFSMDYALDQYEAFYKEICSGTN